ncbi:hypothetical protein BDV38DRAFT_259115 [Aspergillus pseudotamarii]|uniref:Uncharacterized protein n=1 Tax=Aspergillus pseudotamarii TaxID=132259 RepID=A0A5N6SF10_ASPPS|nr:uncharacterized protein BDV38DRAFT_259115 [Aspergillus pseudotamarii]KAE8133195.1 hypothetical protein BDV38DRAFT_259115 [Aspergillus pseudotamarii]
MVVISSHMYSHVCRLWDTSTWICLKSFEDQDNIRDAAFHETANSWQPCRRPGPSASGIRTLENQRSSNLIQVR